MRNIKQGKRILPNGPLNFLLPNITSCINFNHKFSVLLSWIFDLDKVLQNLPSKQYPLIHPLILTIKQGKNLQKFINFNENKLYTIDH